MASSQVSSLQSLLGDIPLAYPLLTILAIIGILYIFRIARALYGEKFSETRVFLIPVVYSIFVSLTFIGASFDELLAALIDTVIGIALGIILSGRIRIFTRKDRVYYRRSLAVVTLWTAFFTFKIMAILYYPQLGAIFLSSVLLTLVTGMIIGEAVRIFHRFSLYSSGDAPPQQQ